MDERQDQPGQLIERLSALGKKDRDAVLSRMSADERGDIENALAHHLEAERLEEERQQQIDRQFLGYSPWLAALIEAAQENSSDFLSETCSKAVWEIHTNKIGDGMSGPRTGWQGFIDRVNNLLALNGEQRT
ncbi:MAG: hypothetical protein AAGI28_04335 [Pseudomonadota bacterium]